MHRISCNNIGKSVFCDGGADDAMRPSARSLAAWGGCGRGSPVPFGCPGYYPWTIFLNERCSQVSFSAYFLVRNDLVHTFSCQFLSCCDKEVPHCALSCNHIKEWIGYLIIMNRYYGITYWSIILQIQVTVIKPSLEYSIFSHSILIISTS
jgi:hypothetical protein